MPEIKIYRNDRGKSRPRLEPIAEMEQTRLRMGVAVDVIAYMKSGFRQMGIRNAKTTLVGAVAEKMAGYDSDIDFLVECTDSTPTVDKVVKIIGAVDKLHPAIQATTKYKLEFHLPPGEVYEEAIKKTGLRTRDLFETFFEEDA